MKLNDTIKNLEVYYSDAHKVKNIIERNAKIAGTAAIGGPLLAYPMALSATIKMYTEISNCLNVPFRAVLIKDFSKDIIVKLTADAVLNNTIITLLPMPFQFTATAYTSVVLAGNKLLEILLLLAKQGKIGDELRNVTNEELKLIIKKCELTDNEVKEAVAMYKANKEK